MQEMQCQNDFRAVESRPILVEFSGPLNLEHQISAVDIFHDEEKSVLKKSVSFEIVTNLLFVNDKFTVFKGIQ